jgi:hypothetical protein
MHLASVFGLHPNTAQRYVDAVYGATTWQPPATLVRNDREPPPASTAERGSDDGGRGKFPRFASIKVTQECRAALT